MSRMKWHNVPYQYFETLKWYERDDWKPRTEDKLSSKKTLPQSATTPNAKPKMPDVKSPNARCENHLGELRKHKGNLLIRLANVEKEIRAHENKLQRLKSNSK